MSDTNQVVQDETKNVATPVVNTNEEAAKESPAVAQNGAATEAKVEETKAE